MLPLTDSHLQLWDKQNLTYTWLEKLPMLDQSFLLSELMEATKSLHVESVVFVQAGCQPEQALAEVEWISHLAKRDARIQGIVAYAPLEQGIGVNEHLSALKAHKLVKGVRRALQTEADDFCLQDHFLQGVKLLADLNWSLDVCVHAHQLRSVIRLVEQYPQIKFIINHLGSPNMASHQLSPWQENMATLAAFPNVWCKLSGLVSVAHHPIWCSEDLKPYVLHAVQHFGVDRLMFGSDWPLVNLAGSYAHWVHTLEALLSTLSPGDLQKIFCQNARQCYQLEAAIIPESLSS